MSDDEAKAASGKAPAVTAGQLDPSPKSVRDLSKKLKTILKFGDDAFEKKNYPYAVAMYRRVLKEEPTCHDVRGKLHDAAVAKCQGRPGLLPKVWGTLLTMTLVPYNERLLALKRFREALDNGEHCVAINPTSSAACSMLAKAAEEAGVPIIAKMALELGQKFNPKDIGLLDYLGFIYEQAGEGMNCLRIYQTLQSLQPNNAKWQDKIRHAAASATIEKDGWQDLEQGKGDFKTVMKDRQQAAVLEQEGRTVATDEGRKLLIETQHRKVEAQDIVENRRRLAELYANDSQWDNAIEWYRKTVELAGVEDPSIERLIIELHAKQFDVQIQQWQDYLGNEGLTDAERADGATQIAALEQQKDTLLLAGYEKTLTKQPTNHDVRFAYAKLLARQNRFDDALAQFQKVQGNPRFKNAATMFIGNCFFAKGVNDLAAEQYRVVIENIHHMDDTKKDAYYQLGKVLQALGQEDEALKCFKEIYQIDIAYKDVRQLIERR